MGAGDHKTAARGDATAGRSAEPDLSDQRLLGSADALDQAWFRAADALARKDYVVARAVLAQIVEKRPSLGIPNLFAMSRVALQEAEAVGGEHALALAQFAVGMSPDDPRSRMIAARYRLTDQGPSTAVARDFWQAFVLQTRHLDDRILLQGRAAAAGLLTLFLLVILFGVAMVLRHGPRLIHNLGHLLPKAARGLPFVVLGMVAAVLAPLSIGVGLVLMSLAWSAILWAYLSNTERVVGALLAGALVAIPWLNGQVERALTYPASDEATVYQCAYGRCPQSLRDRMAAATLTTPSSLHLTAMALPALRVGAVDGRAGLAVHDAVSRMRQAVQADDQNYAAVVGLANAMYVRANRGCVALGTSPDLAPVERLYSQAEALSATPLEAVYNRAVVLRQLSHEKPAKETLARANALDRRTVDLFEKDQPVIAGGCPAAFSGNLHLMSALPTLADLRPVVGDGTGPVLVPFGYLLAGIVDASFMPLMGGATALILLLGLMFGRLIRPAHRCTDCGRIGCGSCRRELRMLDLCEHCLFLKIKGGFVDSRDKWLRDRKVEASQGLEAVANRGISFVLPGFGHLLLGQAVRGSLYLGLCAVTLSYLAVSP
ncbi:MAG: hypothetical protein ACI9WU_003260, partial [Myxococcota bacterium]